jgi:hypothetical protein
VIAERIARLGRLGTGQGRSRAAFALAAWMVHDLGLSTDVALLWLQSWDAGNSPPLGEADLREEVRCAREYGWNAVGSGVNSTRPQARAKRPRSGKHHHPLKVIKFTVRG